MSRPTSALTLSAETSRDSHAGAFACSSARQGSRERSAAQAAGGRPIPHPTLCPDSTPPKASHARALRSSALYVTYSITFHPVTLVHYKHSLHCKKAGVPVLLGSSALWWRHNVHRRRNRRGIHIATEPLPRPLPSRVSTQRLAAALPGTDHLKSFRRDMFLSLSLLITCAQAQDASAAACICLCDMKRPVAPSRPEYQQAIRSSTDTLSPSAHPPSSPQDRHPKSTKGPQL